MGKKVPTQVQARSDEADRLLKEGSEGKGEDLVKKDGVVVEDLSKKPPDIKVVEDTVESLKHKLSVLQGKYNSEIQALKDDVTLLNTLKNQVRTLNGQLNEANLLNADLQKKLAEKPKEAVVDDTDPLSLLSEEDRQHLEDEGFVGKTLEIVAKMVKGITKNAKPADTGNELAEIKKEIHTERVKTFWKELADKVSDWEPINSSDEFNTWLDARIPYSNKTRRDALQEAQGELNHTTVIQIFLDFKAEKPIEKKEGSEGKDGLDLNKHLEPDSTVARQELQKEVPQGKIYTRQEIKDFYTDVTRGKYKGKEAEAAKIDADILKADKEGRIKG
jgi:hypothetical protein